jgi:ABC-type dipeptide/oligopeptide/nickel transport system permease component
MRRGRLRARHSVPATVAKGLATLAFVMWGVATIVFFITRVLPGNPVALFAGPIASPAALAGTKIRLGLDKSIWVQYGVFMKDLVSGNLGLSYSTGAPVLNDLRSRLPATLELVTFAFVIGVGLSIVSAAMAASRRGGLVDRIVRGATLLGMAVPIFSLGLIFLLVFWRDLGWAPAPTGQLGIAATPPPTVTGFLLVDSVLAGDLATFGDALGHLVLPVLTLAIIVWAPLTRVLRVTMVEALDSDYLLGARALGVPLRTRLFVDALKTAAIPVIPVAASIFGFLIGGDVFVEKIFSWPGVGLYAFTAIGNSDYPAIEGFVLAATLVYVLAFLGADLLGKRLDVRLRAQ